MRRPWIAIVVTAAVALVAAPRLFAGDPPAVSAEEAAQIDRLVEDLGSADFRVREAASKELSAKGAKARAALEKGAKSDNPAVRFRADQLLQALDGARSEKPVDDDGPARPPHRAEPGVAGAEKALEAMQREMEKWMKELEKRWGGGAGPSSSDLQREVERAIEEARRRWGMDDGASPFGPPSGPFGPDARFRWIEPWLGAPGARGRPLRVTVDGGTTTVEVVESASGARIAVVAKADPSDRVVFEGRSVEAIVAAQPKAKEWPGVADALEAFAKEKARRTEEAKAAEAARRARAGTPGMPGVASGRTVKVEQADGRVRVEITELGADGKPTTKTYEGTDLETLKQQHPELRDALGGVQFHVVGPGARWGGAWFGPGRTPAPGGGERPLTDDDGDDAPDALAPVPTGPFGLGLVPVDASLRKHLGLEEGAGAHVLAVREGSDAEKLGLRVDDVIVKVNETAVRRLEDVGATIRALAADAPLVVEVLREGKATTLRR